MRTIRNAAEPLQPDSVCACTQFCSGASWLGPLVQALPYVWRFCQCIRVVLDTGADAQRWNALKYATAFPAIVCWGMRPRVPDDEWCALNPALPCYTCFRRAI